MLEELERRNYAESTIRTYTRTVEHYSHHFHCSPDQLGLEHIRQYQAAMFRTWKLAPNTVAQRLAALRFLYIQVLKRGWSAAETPYPKKVLHLPKILTQAKVARLIDATEAPFQRILVMTLYATGARRAEVAHLKVSDIDSRSPKPVSPSAAAPTRSPSHTSERIELSPDPLSACSPTPQSSATRPPDQLNSIQNPRAEAPERAASFKSLYPNRPHPSRAMPSHLQRAVQIQH
jgi:hypothetical protein